MAAKPEDITLKFPVWDFLRQPLFDPSQPFIWHPQRFWHRRDMKLLERCWQRPCKSEGQQLS